jgi:hypothetical protein
MRISDRHRITSMGSPILRAFSPLVMKKFPIHPANPERLCWGCDKYCAAGDMLCGNGSDRTQHPSELWGCDWQEWGE